jgi:hypothetical protein
MEDSVYITLAIAGFATLLAVLISLSIGLSGKNPKTGEGDFILGMGCGAVLVGFSLWVGAFVVWCILHLRIT